MTEPSPRQVLYALVAGGFLVVVAALVVGASVTGLAPPLWTAASGAGLVALSIWSALNWRSTARVLIGSIGAFVIWTIGTLIVAS